MRFKTIRAGPEHLDVFTSLFNAMVARGRVTPGRCDAGW